MKQKLIFIHNPKTAGTSFRVRLYDSIGQKKVYWQNIDGNIDNDFKEYGVNYFDKYKVIGGHFNFGNNFLHKLNGKKIFFSIIRKPIEQTISHLKFIINKKDHPYHISAKNFYNKLSVDNNFKKFMTNLQCRYIGDSNSAEVVIENLSKSQYSLYKMEDIEQFNKDVSELLNISYSPLPQENVDTSDISINLKLKSRIRKFITEDEKLYNLIRSPMYFKQN